MAEMNLSIHGEMADWMVCHTLGVGRSPVRAVVYLIDHGEMAVYMCILNDQSCIVV